MRRKNATSCSTDASAGSDGTMTPRFFSSSSHFESEWASFTVIDSPRAFTNGNQLLSICTIRPHIDRVATSTAPSSTSLKSERRYLSFFMSFFVSFSSSSSLRSVDSTSNFLSSEMPTFPFALNSWICRAM